MGRTNKKNVIKLRADIKQRNKEIKNEILSQTSFLDSIYNFIIFSQRSWHIRNNIFDIQKCFCGKPSIFKNKRYKYSCSTDCKKLGLSLKYGVENVFQLNSVKEKIKSTCLTKYGVENGGGSVKSLEKIKATCFNKYGVENPYQSNDIKIKIKKTCLEKFGVEHHNQSDIGKIAREQTCLKKYGEKHVLSNNKIREQIKETIFNKYGASPFGTGTGWGGWYKGWFFRSIRELSFMIKIIERFNFKWESAESKKMQIKYIDYDDIEKNYYADFLLNDKFLIECKPKKLWTNKKVLLKKDAALSFCKKHNLKYKIIDVVPLNIFEIEKLVQFNIIKFTSKSEIKFQKFLSKSLNT